MNKRELGFTLIAVLSLVIAACSGGDADSTTTTETQTTGAPDDGATTTQQESEGSTSTEGTGEQAPVEQVTVILDWLPGAVHLGLYAAQDNGYFVDENLAVELIPGRGSGTAASLVGAGTETIGHADASAVANAIAEGAPIKYVGSVLQRAPFALAYPCEVGIETPEDLSGKRVAGPAGTANWNFLSALLDQYDMSLEEDVEQIIVDAGAQNAVVLSGQADARSTVAYDVGLQLQASEEDIDICTLVYADYGIATMGHGFIVNESTIESNPDVIERFLRAAYRGLEFAIENPEVARDALMARDPNISQEALDLGWEHIPPNLHTDLTAGESLGCMHPDDWQNTLDLWSGTGVVEADLSPADIYTNEFVPNCDL